MRFVLLVLGCGLILSGCASRKPANTDAGQVHRAPTTSTKSKPEPSANPKSKPGPVARKTKPNEVVTRIEPLSGKVVSANQNLRFVVLDFSLQSLPAVEQRLNVYRDGRKVGELKVSGPARDNNIAADVVAGEAQVGDEAREN